MVEHYAYQQIERRRKVEMKNLISYAPGPWNVDIDLERLGQDGWELVAIHTDQSERFDETKVAPIRETWVFKRREN
jgi:hypothetical protein